MKNNTISEILNQFNILSTLLENANYKSLATIVKALKSVFLSEIKWTIDQKAYSFWLSGWGITDFLLI